MRQRLVAYFDRKNCSTPDELADETLNRVARRLEEEGITASDTTPAKYCYIVARFVFMEYLRWAQKDNALIDDIQPHGNDFAAPEADNEKEIKEKMLDCLEQCTGKLEPLNRKIIIRYYTGKARVKIENRRTLAEELRITINALSIRACRIRDKLEACVKQCLGTPWNTFPRLSYWYGDSFSAVLLLISRAAPEKCRFLSRLRSNYHAKNRTFYLRTCRDFLPIAGKRSGTDAARLNRQHLRTVR